MTESAFGRLRGPVKHRNEIRSEALPYPALERERPIDPALFKYFFNTQVAIEKEGHMNYHKYAARTWQELVMGGMPADLDNDPQFRRFEGNLIIGLHNIDMRNHVYDELATSLGQLAAKYGPSVRSVAIWSTGDSEGTGYQPVKVARSRIISAFAKAMKDFSPDGSLKTDYLVADDKFKRLAEYLDSQKELTKIVVIEDSRGNLKRVEEMVNQLNNVDFVPIWATYSREGIQAKEKAEREGTAAELDAEKQQLHAVDLPREFLDDRFEEVFKDADVLVDFDGVISNNITMRVDQARVKYNALICAVMDKQGVNPEQADKILLDNLAKTAILKP